MAARPPTIAGQDCAVDPRTVEGLTVVEAQLRRLLARARTLSTQMAAAVHPQLDPALYALLMEIVQRAPVRSVELASGRGVSKSVISRQVSSLESLGLVSREADAGDARASVITLTEEGQRAARTIEAARRSHLERLLEGLSADDLHQVGRSLTLLNDVLE